MKAEILYILEPHSIQGYWPGYEEIISELNSRFDIDTDTDDVKKNLKELYAIGAVEVRPVFKEGNGKLNGSGYFVIEKDELKNYAEQLTHHQDARRYIGIELYGRW